LISSDKFKLSKRFLFLLRLTESVVDDFYDEFLKGIIGIRKPDYLTKMFYFANIVMPQISYRQERKRKTRKRHRVF
jgi:hypothetical protein